MTAVDTRCLHEMLPGQCSLCQRIPGQDVLVAASLGKSGRIRSGQPEPARMHARFRNRCPGMCGTQIEVGDPIVHDQDGDVWVCVGCGDGP